MLAYKRKSDFFETQEGVEITQQLVAMSTSKLYNTESSYSTNSKQYPDNQIPFVNRHVEYLRTHPTIDPQQYISNLQLMTRVR